MAEAVLGQIWTEVLALPPVISSEGLWTSRLALPEPLTIREGSPVPTAGGEAMGEGEAGVRVCAGHQ